MVATIIDVLIIIVAAGLAVRKLVKHKKEGKTCGSCGGCGGNCSGCHRENGK